MAPTIVSPSEQRRFDAELAVQTENIRAAQTRLNDALEALGSTWGDEHYRRFKGAHHRAADRLADFYRASSRYRAYLDEAARKGDAYLRRGR